jgi:3-methyladenine DNA glycosylase AlkD
MGDRDALLAEIESLRGAARVLAQAVASEVADLPVRSTPTVRAIRCGWTARLAGGEAPLVRAIADSLLDDQGLRWVAYELIAGHPAAMASLTAADVEALGRGMGSWNQVDTYARTISGPAWARGQVSAGDVARWAGSPDRWWRRAALVSTVALNERGIAPRGDAGRTLAVCRLLLTDRDDMVVKAMSWALRSLAERDPAAVRGFLAEAGEGLAARARREVRHKLDTGVKNPRRNRPAAA